MALADENKVNLHVISRRYYKLRHYIVTTETQKGVINSDWARIMRTARPYILESNPHPFYSFKVLKNQMRLRIACGLDSRSRAGFWKNDRAAVRAVRTIQ